MKCVCRMERQAEWVGPVYEKTRCDALPHRFEASRQMGELKVNERLAWKLK